ncbi:hypothetical protein, partial [Methylosinus sp. Ce-a6]|uniref:hypothetical protein n=1 Tax=Methylosinus sp. Ce-a6 TaxID=2172005 RepID=UPI001AEF0DDA
ALIEPRIEPDQYAGRAKSPAGSFFERPPHRLRRAAKAGRSAPARSRQLYRDAMKCGVSTQEKLSRPRPNMLRISA